MTVVYVGGGSIFTSTSTTSMTNDPTHCFNEWADCPWEAPAELRNHRMPCAAVSKPR